MATEEEYREIATELKKAFVVVRTEIPSDILGKAPELRLTAEQYQKLAVSMYMQAHPRKYGNGSGEGKHSDPTTPDQQNYLAGLAMNRDGADGTIQSFLDANSKKSMEELDLSHASTLIDMLKALPKKERRHNRAPTGKLPVRTESDESPYG